MPAPVLFTRSDLTVGDTVRARKQPRLDLRGDYVIGIVTEVPDGGVEIDGAAYNNVGDSTFEILRFANGIPNTAAVAWWDYDRNEHIAIRSGHPLNQSWVYNGRRIHSDLIVSMAGSMTIAGLDWVDVP